MYFFLYLLVLAAYIFAITYYKDFIVKILDISEDTYQYVCFISTALLPLAWVALLPIFLAKYLKRKDDV